MMMIIAFITFNSSLVPLFEGLSGSNPWEFEFSGFTRNQTNDLEINSPLLWPTEPRLHVRFESRYICKHGGPFPQKSLMIVDRLGGPRAYKQVSKTLDCDDRFGGPRAYKWVSENPRAT